LFLASDTSAHHFLSHVSSDGRPTRNRIVASAYAVGATAWTALGNVDWGSGVYGTPFATAFGWFNSSEHREHMLDPQVEGVGVGIAEGRVTADGARGVFYVAGVRGTAKSALAPTSKRLQPAHAPEAPYSSSRTARTPSAPLLLRGFRSLP
jgi:hypothetical protein